MTAPADVFGLVGATLDGKYDVEAVVAEGGFGVVYRGVHRGLRKAVAIKMLKVPENLDLALRRHFLEKFAQEARLIADLDHPAIVRVLDFGVSPTPLGAPTPWMVLEWLEGVSLEHDLEARQGAGGRSPADALALLRPAFEALTVAHDAGIAHRDLKPANLMIGRDRRGTTALRVLDFGIAKVMRDDESAGGSGRTATQAQLQAFSLPYAAPEQVSGTRTGPWTDVHALGLILAELLTDEPPYRGDELTELYAAVLSPTRPTPAQRGVDVGPWEPVLARALAFRPAERYQGAGEFLAALEAAVPEHASRTDAHEAVTTPRARRPADAPTTLRPAAMHSQVAPSSSWRRVARVFGAVAVVVVLVGVLIGARNATQEQRRPSSNIVVTTTALAVDLTRSRRPPPMPPLERVPVVVAIDAGVVPLSAPPRPARVVLAHDPAPLRSEHRRPAIAPAAPVEVRRAGPRYIPAE